MTLFVVTSAVSGDREGCRACDRAGGAALDPVLRSPQSAWWWSPLPPEQPSCSPIHMDWVSHSTDLSTRGTYRNSLCAPLSAQPQGFLSELFWDIPRSAYVHQRGHSGTQRGIHKVVKGTSVITQPPYVGLLHDSCLLRERLSTGSLSCRHGTF